MRWYEALSTLVRIALAVAAVGPLGARAAAGAELRVLAAGATESTVRAVAAEFEARSGTRLRLSFGGVGALRDRVTSGEGADVLVATPAALEPLVAKELVRPGSRVDLGRVGGGLAVRAGEPRPAVGSPEELKKALLAAEEVYYPDPASTTAGAHLLAVADGLGVGAEVRRKGRTSAGGRAAMELMGGSRTRALGATQISEIRSVPQVELVGPYPPSLQKMTTYSGVVLKGAERADAAAAFLAFLASPPVQARFREAGFEGM
ncbi:MAG TPA: substrate-binding domain-containing protein [Anaeromyxobacteraceae bacterium]|nr:substrate-binding domain-containing protein [Anaeromyxobacteraceae bacterium]